MGRNDDDLDQQIKDAEEALDKARAEDDTKAHTEEAARLASLRQDRTERDAPK